MSSINFNGAAVSALRTLQQSNAQLDATQGRISSGLKIGEAKDNAAYWSISTTLKSDNKALSTVSDALGLGAATVDTAYQGLNSTLDVLDQIKTKLVAATQDGVDKSAVQGEIAELQKQLKSIAASSTFSGENWLAIDSSVPTYNATKSVVSAFNRNSTGAVSIDTIKIDTTSFVLTNGNALAEGILDAGKTGNLAVNGLGTIGSMSAVVADGAKVTGASTFVAAAGTLVGSVVVDGASYGFSVTTTSTGPSTIDSVVNDILTTATNSAGQLLSGVAQQDGAGTLKFKTTATGSARSITFNVTTAASGIGIQATAGTAGIDASKTITSNQFGSAGSIVLDANDTISLNVTADGAVKNFSLTRSAVDAALGTAANGTIANAQQYAAVINKALEQSNITGIVATGSGTLTTSTVALTVKGATTLSSTGATASMGQSILTLNVATADKATITNYIAAVSKATNSVTAAAATVGAVASRIDLQKTFVKDLMDTIDKGISGLIDADMNEESTKLQALQVKQSLGVQALSIANQSAQNVLRLFQ